MPRLRSLLLVLTLCAGALTLGATPAAAGVCGGGTVEVKGRVRDVATTLPLPETASVGVYQGGVSIDGLGTDSTGRWSTCLTPGTYTFRFDADNYRSEFFHNQPAAGPGTNVVVVGPDPVVVNESMVPKGKVLAGQVTNEAGAPVFASVGIWRQTSAGWRPIDGIANDLGGGRWEFRVPMQGRYRVHADVDHHWSEFYNNKPRLSLATTIVVGPSTTYINGINLSVKYCTASTPDFCQPFGFTS